jgi:hypothetical protein
MERLSSALRELESQDFAGLSDFVWWYGVVEDRKDPLYLGRLKVRCIGFHTDNKDEIPTDELPWAQVISPITSSGISGIGTTPVGLIEGSHVFGFFRDGKEGQEPVVLGSCVGIPSVMANRRKGFFDPRSFEDKTMYPYPPFYIDRTRDGKPGHIVDFHENVDKVYYFRGENTYAKTGSKLYYEYDSVSDKAIAIVKQTNDDFVRASLQTYSSNPNENFMEFDIDGNLIYSLPSINMLSYDRQKLQTRTDRDIKNNPSEKESENYQNSINIFSDITKKIFSVNAPLEEYRQRLHQNILTAKPNININVPENCYSPEYPFNHVTYTESGHLFEMDDTPGRERIRLLHRTTSFLDFQNNGNRIDNVVGKYYLMIDNNLESQVFGDEIRNVGGVQNILVNSKGKKSESVFRIKGLGDYLLTSDEGSIFISAGEELNLSAKRVNIIASDEDSDKKTYSLDGFNFRVRNSDFVNIENISEQIRLNTVGKLTFEAGSMSQSVNGELRQTVNGSVQKSVIGKASEVYAAVGNAKVESATLGNLMFYCVNPISNIILKHGLTEEVSTSELKLSGINGFEYSTLFGGATFDLNSPIPSNFNVNASGSIEMNGYGPTSSLSLYNTIGANVTLNPTGLISIKNSASSLKGIIDKILDAISKLTVTTANGPSGTPINAAEFSAIKVELATYYNKI